MIVRKKVAVASAAVSSIVISSVRVKATALTTLSSSIRSFVFISSVKDFFAFAIGAWPVRTLSVRTFSSTGVIAGRSFVFSFHCIYIIDAVSLLYPYYVQY